MNIMNMNLEEVDAGAVCESTSIRLMFVVPTMRFAQGRMQ